MKTTYSNTTIPSNSIAIIGMSCRVPGAENIHAFWQNLVDGVESLTHFSDEELLASGVDPSWLDNPRYVKVNAILRDVTLFDADFFDVPPREAEVLDPQQRLFLECAWEALESAGIDPHTYSGNIGVYAGMRSSEYLMFNQDPLDQVGFTTESPIIVTQRHWANDKDFLATRVSFKLNLRGPAMTVQTACSTSLVTIHLAIQSLLAGECDAALAGGVTIRVPQRAGYVFSDGMIFSPDGHTRSFDAQANGMIFSSGVGVITLKRLEDAIADKDNIFAVIRGTAVNNDGGGEKTRYSAPTVSGQSRVILEAQEKANIDPETITYIEAHGTATQVGDPIEVAGLTEAFRQKTDKKVYCAIGSVKSNIGHTVQAAGVIGVIKVALMLQHKALVPSLHFSVPNPRIDFENSPFFVNTDHCPWPDGDTARRAGVSSFGVGGTNAHVILEEAPPLPEKAGSANIESILTLTAKNETALRDLAQAYHHFFSQNPKANLADVCFTASNGRTHFGHRLAIMAKSSAEMQDKLAEFVAEEMPVDAYKGESESFDNPLAFLFTGQGAQYGGMGQQLYETEPLFRATMDRCETMLEPYLATPLLEVLYPQDGSENPLIHQTAYTQPALFALEYSLAILWQSWGIRPTHVMGHSVGEYVAACVAGILSVEDGIRLIAERGRLMQSLPQEGRMAIIFASEEQVNQAIALYASQISIAAVNGPANIVISGVCEAVDAVVAQFEADDVRTRPLTTSHAFHSQLMEPILDAFEEVAASVTQSSPQLTVISNVTGLPVDAAVPPAAAYWRDHVRNPVRFSTAIEYLAEMGCTRFVEIGPNPTLLGMARRCLPDLAGTWLPSVRKGQDARWQMRQSLAQLYVGGAPVNWMAVFPSDFGRRIELPTYPFQRKRIWIERKANKGETAVTANLISNSSHALLGGRLLSPLAETQYLAEINPNTTPFLQEHRAFDVIALPAAAYVEMVHTAAGELFGTERPQITIKGLVIHQALLFPESDEQTVQLILSPIETGQAEFKIYSLSQGEKVTWTLHVSGKVIGERQGEGAEAVDLLAVQARLPEKLPIAEFYQEKRDRGIYHGLHFQGVRDVWRTDGEALGWIQLPRIARSVENNFRMHPALLDACIQISMSAFPANDESEPLYLPMVWERIRFLAPVPHELWSHAKTMANAEANAELRTVDLDLYDAAGQLVAKVEGLHYKRARREALLQATAATPAQDWLYRIAWRRQRLVDAEKVDGSPPDSWIIFADGDGLGTALAKQLKSLGHKTWLVVPFDTPNLNGGESPTVRLRNSGQLDALFKQYTDANRGVNTGILYLRGIDSADFGPENPASVTQKQETAVGGLMRLVQAVSGVYSTDQPSPKLWVLTQGAQAVGRQPGPYGVAQATLWGLGKVIAREHPELACTLIDIDPAATPDELEDVLAELQISSAEKQIAFRGDTRYVARLVPHFSQDEAKTDRLALPESRMYRLESKDPGTFDGLKLEPMQRQPPTPGEVEIQVQATGLNFRDVLIALGRFDDVIGRECSGVVVTCGAGVTNVTVGDEVMAIAAESFASYVTVKSNYVVPKPKHLSFTEAATVPMVFLTAFYGLHTLAKMKHGDRVLIHAASGGVGHAAVQLAQQCGAEIYATASRKKWAYLRSLGLKNIMDSRTLDFADEIMQMTGDAGVDIVLNSLAGDFITKSLEALGDNGRFIEIGATNVWDQDQMAAIRPDIDYHWFHLGQSVAQKKPDFFQEMFQQVADGFAAGTYKPLPRYVFQIQEAVDAFRFISQAKHIGKVVVRHQLPTSDASPEIVQRIHGDGTYLVTGGLGGLGLKVARWLADKGAKNLVLLGRSAPSETAVAVLNDLESRGVNTLATQADVADLAALRAALANVNEKMPPLRGVIHAAGILVDGILQQQDWARFQAVLAPKVDGAWNLHRLTEEMPLDFFVLFSSVSSLWGGAGQGSYAAANAFLDTLAHYRQARGLTAISINWGPWSEVGMAVEMDEAVKRRRAMSGMGEIDPELGMTILNKILHTDRAQIGVIPADWSRYAQQFSDEMQRTFLIQLAQKKRSYSQKSAAKRKAQPNLRQRLETAKSIERKEILIEHLQTEIARIGGMDKVKLDMNASLDEMGIDSLMAIELRSQIAKDLQVDIPMSEFLSNPAITYLVDLLLAESDPAPESDILVVPMAIGGNRRPFFCIHGIGGGVMDYIHTARQVAQDQPFYAIQAAGLNGEADPDTTIEAMAARCVHSMTAVQPNGPYLIGGYCFGGVVAYEMARQLAAAGVKLGFVGIMEGAAPLRYQERKSLVDRDRLHAVWRNLPYWMNDYRDLGMARVRQRLRIFIPGILPANSRSSAKTKLPEPQDVIDADVSQLSEKQLQMIALHIRAMHAYVPGPYDGQVTLFRAQVQSVGKTIFGASDPTLGWGSLALAVKVVEVDGVHRNIHLPPNVSSLAQSLQEELARAENVESGT